MKKTNSIAEGSYIYFDPYTTQKFVGNSKKSLQEIEQRIRTNLQDDYRQYGAVDELSAVLQRLRDERELETVQRLISEL